MTWFLQKLQDIARLTFTALRNEKLNNKLLTFAGPRAWTTQEVLIDLFVAVSSALKKLVTNKLMRSLYKSLSFDVGG